MKILNQNLKRESLTRAKKTTKPFVIPKKDMTEENINIVIDGSYWIISKGSSKSQENPQLFWEK